MTNEQIKADAINDFICQIIGAREAGFIDSSMFSLAELHQVARNHIKDELGIPMPSLAEQWGAGTAELCRGDQ